MRAQIGVRSVDGGPYVVSEETDEPTETAKGVPSGDCEVLVEETVTEIPIVQKRIAEASAAAEKAGISFGDTGLQPDGRGAYVEGFGYDTDRPNVVSWVIYRNGTIRVTLDGKAIDVPDDVKRDIELMCTR